MISTDLLEDPKTRANRPDQMKAPTSKRRLKNRIVYTKVDDYELSIRSISWENISSFWIVCLRERHREIRSSCCGRCYVKIRQYTVVNERGCSIWACTTVQWSAWFYEGVKRADRPTWATDGVLIRLTDVHIKWITLLVAEDWPCTENMTTTHCCQWVKAIHS